MSELQKFLVKVGAVVVGAIIVLIAYALLKQACLLETGTAKATCQVLRGH